MGEVNVFFPVLARVVTVGTVEAGLAGATGIVSVAGAAVVAGLVVGIEGCSEGLAGLLVLNSFIKSLVWNDPASEKPDDL